MKYRLITHEIEAVQWTGRNQSDLVGFCHPERVTKSSDKSIGLYINGRPLIILLNDWLVRRDKTLAVYTNDAFLENYEPV